jgi:hypothetical protein
MLDIGFGAPQRQRRWSVALRGLLVLPQLVAVWVLAVVALVLAFIGWFAALVLGRLPLWIAEFELNVIAYSVRVVAYAFMLADEYPPFAFSPTEYPIAVQIDASQLSRLKVFFRWLLVIPAYVVTAIAGNGLLLLSPVIWLVTLVLGRMPQPFFSAAAAVIRYQARYSAYETATTAYLAIGHCKSRTDVLRCADRYALAWGYAFNRFASDLSSVSFPPSKRGQASAVVHDARMVGQALLVVSKRKTLAGYTGAYRNFEKLLHILEADANSLLGHRL